MKQVLIFIIAISIKSFALAQSDIITWSVSAEKKSANLYAVNITATIQGTYHLYAQDPGVEGPAPTRFTFNKNPYITIEGKLQEQGELIRKFESVWGGVVHYYEKSVSFVQLVKVKKGIRTRLSGKVECMLCDEERCMPPVETSFDVTLGDRKPLRTKKSHLP